jgi:hypothetical protein
MPYSALGPPQKKCSQPLTVKTILYPRETCQLIFYSYDDCTRHKRILNILNGAKLNNENRKYTNNLPGLYTYAG